ncbi:MAG TPA: hypothetical protein VK835_12405 [Bacteroidia bacterium]|nr:hypothetical protein [Bacteroidia bacterium]
MVILHQVTNWGDQPVNLSAYKPLTVNGDVSLANYHTGNTGNSGDGETAVEVLGNDKVPTRRGISVDSDPKGDLNFFINTNQSDGNNTTEFHFKNGAKPDYSPYSNATAAPSLMTINNLGEVIIPKLPSATNATGVLKSLLVDANGKLVPGANIASTNSVAWALGGNNSNGNSLGTTDGSDLVFVAGQASGTQRMRINGTTGQVRIGIRKPNSGYHDGSMLSVDGDITTTAVYVTDPTGTLKWSDFVFDATYKLMPLNELEAFYKQNHHLPSVPTTKEVQENGNNLAETDAVLLQKIEELTLYVVQQQKTLEQQQKEIAELKKKLNNK